MNVLFSIDYFLYIPVPKLLIFVSPKPCMLSHRTTLSAIQRPSYSIPHLFWIHTNVSSSLCLGACHIPLLIIILIPLSAPSRCIRALSIPCGCPPWREAHFLILELPERQRLTGPRRPTRTQQTQPRSCLQEVDSKPFVFSFYKRKFCTGLPGSSDEANTHTQNHCYPFHSLTQKHTNTHTFVLYHAHTHSLYSDFTDYGSGSEWGVNTLPSCTPTLEHLILLFKQLPPPVSTLWRNKSPTWQPGVPGRWQNFTPQFGPGSDPGSGLTVDVC